MINIVNNSRYEVYTPSGFKPFTGIRRTTKSKVLLLEFYDNSIIKCSFDHIFIINNQEILSKNLKKDQYISKNKQIKSITKEDYKDYLYDLINVGKDSLYITDDIISHNCNFSTSGETVIEPDILNWIESTTIEDPVEKRGMDGNLWIWEPVDYNKNYAVIADVARGDGKDYSAFHIIDIEANVQVGEYKGQIGTREYGNLLVGISTEYNDAMLVIENNNIGWDVVQTAIERGYKNLYYSPSSDVALTNVEMYLNKFNSGNGMVPGFSTNLKTRPLVISKLISYLNDRLITIKSKRTLAELRTFIWKNGKAQAMDSYNDDLVLPLSIGMFLRDTALRFMQTGEDLARASLSGIGKSGNNGGFQIYNPGDYGGQNPWKQTNIYGQQEDISWLI
jgi:hypothetical protein